jgi:hypothetical protein
MEKYKNELYKDRAKPVELPNKGNIHILNNGYLYWEDDGRCDNGKRISVNSRVSIGKLDPSDKNKLLHNRTYLGLFVPKPKVKVK